MVGAKELRERFQREFNINLGYNNVWKARAKAVEAL